MGPMYTYAYYIVLEPAGRQLHSPSNEFDYYMRTSICSCICRLALHDSYNVTLYFPLCVLLQAQRVPSW